MVDLSVSIVLCVFVDGGAVAAGQGLAEGRRGRGAEGQRGGGVGHCVYCGCVLGRALWGREAPGSLSWLVRQWSPCTAGTAESRTLVERLGWRQCPGQTSGDREDLGRSTRPGPQSLGDGAPGTRT